MEEKMEHLKLNSLGVTDDEAQQIGLRLKEKRETNTDSIEKITTRLKINKIYLEIIESGEWNLLPQSANGRGFVQLYATELGVSLPEFEKFRNVQKALDTAETKTNLDNLIACAKEKRLVHMNSYQTLVSRAGPMIKSFLSSKKKWILVGSFGFIVVGTTITAFLSNKKSLPSDMDNTLITLNEGTDSQAPAEQIQLAPTEPIQTAPTPAANSSINSSIETAQTTPVDVAITPPQAAATMQLEVLSPVEIHINSDGKQIAHGLTQPGTINLEFKRKILLILEDSSKVKLTYAGWEHEQLSPNIRKRNIVLNAKPFEG